MDLKQIKELIAAMERAGIKKLTLKQKGGDELHLERQMEHPEPLPPPSVPHPPSYASHVFPSRDADPSTRHHQKPPSPSDQTDGKHVVSPLVGTFYSSPSPDDPVFVQVGDRVEENTVVCIVEAMKVMNEVKAGISGTVAEVLVENAHPVEFGTKMFRIT